ncbi:uncharacterized protein LOC144987157 [Oryzias latipes]
MTPSSVSTPGLKLTTPSSASTPRLKLVPPSSAPTPRSLRFHGQTRPRFSSLWLRCPQRQQLNGLQGSFHEGTDYHVLLLTLSYSGKINQFQALPCSELLPGFSIWVYYVYDAMTERTGHYPDPDDPEEFRFALNQHGLFLELLYSTISRVTTVQEDLLCRLNSFSQALVELTSQQPANATPHPPPSGAGSFSQTTTSETQENFPLQPEPFQGDVNSCGGFLLQCQLIFQQAPRYYQADHSKITLIVNSLRGKALQWAQAYLTTNPVFQFSFECFIGEFRLVFDQPPQNRGSYSPPSGIPSTQPIRK